LSVRADADGPEVRQAPRLPNPGCSVLRGADGTPALLGCRTSHGGQAGRTALRFFLVVRGMDAELVELLAQRQAGDAEPAGSFGLVAPS
jgi:hypothetical protein